MSCRLVLIRVLAGYDIIDGGAAQGDTESGFNATFNYPGYLQAGGYSGTNRTPYLYEQSGGGTFQININQTLGINTLGEVFALDDAQPSYAAGTAVIDHNTWNSPVIWTKNGLIVLPGRGGAQAINNARHVAGWSRDAAGNSLAHLWKNHYQPGTVLGTLGGPSSAAFGINALDQVVGSADQVDGKSHAFSWTSTGGMVDIHPGGDNSEARSVNDKGAIVGWTQAAPGNPANRSAFVKPSGQTASLLPHLPGNQVSEALAVNNAGLVVGFSGQEAAIWSGGEVARLVDQVFNASGWILSKANDIGEGGAIVGRGRNPQGQIRGFLLVPRFTFVPHYFCLRDRPDVHETPSGLAGPLIADGGGILFPPNKKKKPIRVPPPRPFDVRVDTGSSLAGFVEQAMAGRVPAKLGKGFATTFERQALRSIERAMRSRL